MDGKKFEYKGKEALKELDRLTKNTVEVQEKILKEIISRNKETEYLSKYLKGSESKEDDAVVEDFKSLVPVITYSAILPYIQRIADGEDSSLITSHRITEMLISSGTSNGEPKLMPTIAEDLDRRTFLYNLLMPIMNQYVPGLHKGKAMYLYFVKAEMSTPSGLPTRTVLTSYYKSKHFKGRARDAFNDFTSPDAAILCNDSNQSMYCQLLAGLIHRSQVLRLGAVFASAFLRAISFLEQNWSKLCHDIRTQTLNPCITDPECHLALSTLLSSLSDTQSLADEIETICGSSSWKGILVKLWPKAKYIEAVVTGSMAQYIPSLEYYSGGELPLVCLMYASSECYFGVNLKPLCDPSDVVFTLLPNMCYFEFIPLGDDGTWIMNVDDEEVEIKGNRLVRLTDVKLGCFYELVVTTFAGLYRYRIGDVVQVAGFHNEAPQFRFICRRNVVLSVDTDKTSEEDLHKSITKAKKKLLEPHSAMLVEYTSCVDTTTAPGHYVLFWEIRCHQNHHHHQDNNNNNNNSSINNGNNNGNNHFMSNGSCWNTTLEPLLRECCAMVEQELDEVYIGCRTHERTVGPLEIRVVKSGTFEKLMDFYIRQGGSINQYKTPRCIRSSDALELLNSNVEGRFFSDRDPEALSVAF